MLPRSLDVEKQAYFLRPKAPGVILYSQWKVKAILLYFILILPTCNYHLASEVLQKPFEHQIAQ